MAFKDLYQLRHDQGGIYVYRGKFREQEWWEPCFEGAPTIINEVYKLMEAVYNTGEHDGRRNIRSAIKAALDISDL